MGYQYQHEPKTWAAVNGDIQDGGIIKPISSQTPGVIWCVTQDRPADRYCVNQGHTHRTGVQLETAETESTELEQLREKIGALVEELHGMGEGAAVFSDWMQIKLKELL